MSGTLIDFTRSDGRSLWSWEYVVAYTYEGFMVRSPSERCNEYMLDGIPRKVSRYFGDGWPIHVAHPLRQPGEIDYPPVRIIAFVTSMPMIPEMHLSSLVVVWFQQKRYPVPDKLGRAALDVLDWERLAIDYET